jgi:hypothetical protein
MHSKTALQLQLRPLLLIFLQAWSCVEGAANQHWQKGADGSLRPSHALQSCMDVTGGDFRPGTRIQVRTEICVNPKAIKNGE